MSKRDAGLFARAFRRKSALFGIGIVIIFILIGTVGATTAPFSNGYSPPQFDAAAPNALPGWVSVFPGFQSLPPNIAYPSSVSAQEFKTAAAVAAWSPAGPSASLVHYSSTVGPSGMTPAQRAYELVNSGPGSELINASGNSQTPISLEFGATQSYRYSSPSIFAAQVAFDPASVTGAGVAVFLSIKTTNGTYPLALEANPAGVSALESGSSASAYLSYFTNPIIPALQEGSWNYVSGVTTATQLMPLYYLNSSVVSGAKVTTLASTIFKGITSYTLGETVMIFPQGKYSVQIYQSDLKYQVLGKVYGVLGTDTNGADFWSEFAIGARAALEIASGAAVITLAIGITVGLIGGFFGGIVDSGLLLLTDFLLLIPALILLVDLDTVFTLAHIITNKILLLDIIFGVLLWPVLSRTIRSQTLSLRSTTYVIAAGAMGGGRLYVLRRHILNHVVGTIIALTIFLLAGFVVLDVGVDFLGLGITQTPTWGNIFASLVNTVSPSNGYLWWMTLPLSAAILLVSVSFFFIGYAIQSEYSRAA
ncbi:MAG: ABC transporter permease [Nitrososphaerota archaeon]|nr:ABC transporter permease [Nitrososphaerota archaeon]